MFVTLLGLTLLVAPVAGGPPLAGSFGYHVTLFGDPYPSITGAGLDYHLTDFLRLEGHIGYLGVGASAKATVPDYDLTPVLGLSAALTRVAGVWQAEPYVTFGLVLWGRKGQGLEGGVNCTDGLFAGDFSECSPYLRFSALLVVGGSDEVAASDAPVAAAHGGPE